MNFLFDVDQEQEVKSSMISIIGTKETYLIVKFKDGSVYRYPNMSHYYDALLNTDSVGKLFSKELKHQEFDKLQGGLWPIE
jgi:hypothetical protein